MEGTAAVAVIAVGAAVAVQAAAQAVIARAAGVVHQVAAPREIIERIPARDEHNGTNSIEKLTAVNTGRKYLFASTSKLFCTTKDLSPLTWGIYVGPCR